MRGPGTCRIGSIPGRIELIVSSIPLLVIMLLGGVAWIGSHDLDPAKPLASDTPPLEIQGVSLDWKWLFVYPKEGVASVNQLVVPAGVPVHFSLTSASVMNAFFVAQLGLSQSGGKIDRPRRHPQGRNDKHLRLRPTHGPRPHDRSGWYGTWT
jgi:hypothetical protein